MTEEAQSQLKQGHLALALQYTQSSWFPSNPKILELVERSLSEPKLDSNERLTLMFADAALFGLVLRQLMASHPGITSLSELAQLLSPIERPILEQALASAKSCMERHSLDSASSSQLWTIQETIVSTTAAGVLAAGSTGTEPSLLHRCSANIRYLGMNLLAWNYPHIFRRAQAQIARGESWNATLSRTLGFSPFLLGKTVIEGWKVPEELVLSLGDGTVFDSPAPPVVEELRTIASVSEALAQATSGFRYPQQEQQWQTAASFIDESLGASGWRSLAAAIEKSSTLFGGVAFPIPSRIAERGASTSRTASRHETLLQLPQQLRQEFLDLYQLRSDGITADVIVNRLLRVLGSIGAPVIRIYELTPGGERLRLRWHTSNPGIAIERELSRVPDGPGELHPVHAAARGAEPVHGKVRLSNKQETGWWATPIGGTSLTGVLYLEGQVGGVQHAALPLCLRAAAQLIGVLLARR